MNGYELFNKAILRLGYSESIKDKLLIRAKELINQILVDLNLNGIEGLSDTFSYDNKIIDSICCGVAMLLALSESDGEKHKIFCDIYNAKRGMLLSKSSKIEDVMPLAEGGEN